MLLDVARSDELQVCVDKEAFSMQMAFHNQHFYWTVASIKINLSLKEGKRKKGSFSSALQINTHCQTIPLHLIEDSHLNDDQTLPACRSPFARHLLFYRLHRCLIFCPSDDVPTVLRQRFTVGNCRTAILKKQWMILVLVQTFNCLLF